MWEEKNINWTVFTRAEKDTIMQARRVGDIKHIASLVDNFTPAKEIELQKIIDALTPATEGFESKVRKEMESHFKKKGISGPQSPAEEGKWENKLQEEYSKFLSKKQDKESKRIAALKGEPEPEKKEEPEEPEEDKPVDYDELSRKELVEMAEDNNISTAGNKDDIVKKIKKALS